MHYKNEAEIQTTTAATIEIEKIDSTKSPASCTSSTDSGIIMMDNCGIPGNENSSSDNYTKDGQQTEEHNNTKNINIENIVSIHSSKHSPTPSTEKRPQSSKQAQNSPRHSPTANSSRRCSPAVSIRSTTISIVSIDENAIDSSIIDSDSEGEVDDEGVHSNYVVKKLGQQMTYPPNSPDLPDFNKGFQVVSQQISPQASPGVAGVGPLAEQVLNGGLALTPHSTAGGAGNTPQIGSIALTNSTDVTFGDKHFYEGPVTIQQFLIDGRDKWKGTPPDGDGLDNPTYTHENGVNHAKAGGGVSGHHSQEPQQEKPFGFILNRKAIIATSIIVFLTVFIAVIIFTATDLLNAPLTQSKLIGDGDDSRKNIPINSTIDPSNGDGYTFNGTLIQLHRSEWQGRAAKADLDNLNLPVHRVIISHTASETCLNLKQCSYRCRIIQQYHMDSYKWDDIGYNFLIGGDGLVYTGRGWDKQGAHTKGYNVDSVGVSLIGTFTTRQPTPQQLKATQLLLAEGVRLGKLVKDYRLYGARQLSGTESPAKDNIGGGRVLRVLPRDAWLAEPPQSTPIPLQLPVKRIIVLPTQTDDCTTQAACTYRVRYIQTFNIESLRHDDIIYNFLIGGDGSVYEGRGWDHKGAHLQGFNDDSVSFAFIGTFRKQPPAAKQMNVTALLIAEGLRLGKLSANYKIYGAKLLEPSAPSADALYASFKGWPHWVEAN